MAKITNWLNDNLDYAGPGEACFQMSGQGVPAANKEGLGSYISDFFTFCRIILPISVSNHNEYVLVSH